MDIASTVYNNNDSIVTKFVGREEEEGAILRSECSTGGSHIMSPSDHRKKQRNSNQFFDNLLNGDEIL